jgi:hypothetical protein
MERAFAPKIGHGVVVRLKDPLSALVGEGERNHRDLRLMVSTRKR